jgi:2-polyprenyl-3-methyl-5-hydroxy-6-metoxy-1,4-benzoquinol methylase
MKKDIITQHSTDILQRNRFEFGKNWERFLGLLTNARIIQAEQSICDMLGVKDLTGKSFLDAGSGSGLFSLAARRLGATVYSFDFDPDSVACTRELKRRYFPGDANWTIDVGSVLDPDYLERLGNFNIVYSWGVLHHTGNMWNALSNVINLVDDKGYLILAIYNDQGWISKYWLMIKKIYLRGAIGRGLMISLHIPYLYLFRFFIRKTFRRAPLERGMDLWVDMLDWLGGYPFEVAKPKAIINFYNGQGFELVNKKLQYTRLGCNEYCFRKENK